MPPRSGSSRATPSIPTSQRFFIPSGPSSRDSSGRAGCCGHLRWRLRDAAAWDQCPLIAANVFLNEPGKVEVSAAARELSNVAGSEEYEGKKQDWTSILEGELGKAREIQGETSG